MQSGLQNSASVPEKPVAAFTLTLIAGILIIAGSGVPMIWFAVGAPYWSGMMGAMMGGHQMMIWSLGYARGMFLGMMALGIVSGAMVLVGAQKVYSNPGQAVTWGAVIIAFSIVSFFGMGGFLAGAVLGIVGGVLALTWKTPQGS